MTGRPYVSSIIHLTAADGTPVLAWDGYGEGEAAVAQARAAARLLHAVLGGAPLAGGLAATTGRQDEGPDDTPFERWILSPEAVAQAALQPPPAKTAEQMLDLLARMHAQTAALAGERGEFTAGYVATGSLTDCQYATQLGHRQSQFSSAPLRAMAPTRASERVIALARAMREVAAARQGAKPERHGHGHATIPYEASATLRATLSQRCRKERARCAAELAGILEAIGAGAIGREVIAEVEALP